MSGVTPKGRVDGAPVTSRTMVDLRSAMAEAEARNAVSGSPEADTERKASVEETADWLRRYDDLPESERSARHDALEIEARAHLDHLRRF